MKEKKIAKKPRGYDCDVRWYDELAVIPKSNKYKVASKDRRTADGITFHSMAEMNRYRELKGLEKAGIISDLELQPKLLLIPKTEKGGRAVYYYADFGYTENGKRIYEDIKGFLTKEYKLKKKLLLWQYPDIQFYENKV